MPSAFPHEYAVSLSWTTGRSGSVTGAGRTLIAGPPPQFDGTDEWWSPEELLLSAAASCLMTTFVALAEKAALKFEKLDIRAAGTLEKGKDGIRFTRIVLHASIVSTEPERARELLAKAKKYCIVSNALNVPQELEVTV